MADQLATPTQVQTRLQTSSGTGVAFTATDIAVITEIMEEVTDFCQQYTGRRFLPVSSADYVFDTVYGSVLHVPIGLRTITTLGVATTNQPDAAGTYTTIPAADYLLRPKAQDTGAGWPFTQILLAATASIRYFQTVRNGCKLTGATVGFAAVPPDMQAVGIDATIAAWQARKNGASGVIGMDDAAIVPWRSFFSKGSPQRATLDRYRVFSV